MAGSIPVEGHPPQTNGAADGKGDYQVVSIEKVAPRDGEGEWYQYVVQSGSSTITGFRCGSLRQVQEYVQQFTEQLNARTGAASRSHWSRGRIDNR